MSKQPGKRRAVGTIDFDTVRQIVQGLPGVVEGTSYGTPAFRARKTLFVRQHQDGESLVVRMDSAERSMRMKTDPVAFYLTDHYRDTPWVLVRLANVDPQDLREILEDAWQLSASPRDIAERASPPENH